MFTNLTEYVKSGTVVLCAGVVAYLALNNAGIFDKGVQDEKPAVAIKLSDGSEVLEKRIDTAESVPDYSSRAVSDAKTALKKDTGKSFEHVRNSTVKLTNTTTGEVVEAALDTVKADDGTTRVVLSTPDAQAKEWKVSGIDTVIVPDSAAVKYKNAAGIYGSSTGKDFGIFYDRDIERARVGVELGVQNAKPRVALKLGITF